jgi:hypothetical protein
MRDEPLDAPIPESFKPAPFYQDKIKAIESEYEKLQKLSSDEINQMIEKEFVKRRDSLDKQLAERKAMKHRYESMLEEAKTWEPPTSDHSGLKDFMVKQLTESIEYDCDLEWVEKDLKELVFLSEREWMSSKIKSLNKDLAYYRKAYAEEVERVSNRNLWITELRDSFTKLI